MAAITILDGPMGTELLRRGVPTPLPRWSAQALLDAPRVVEAIHGDYATAGATVHTANTFRTKRRTLPDDWEHLARLALRLCRSAVPAGHRVAGSIAPLEDCYRPDLSPAARDPHAALAEHAELARVLADAGCDLLLCETFPHVGEALLAVQACVATNVETWVSFTAGPQGDLLTPGAIADGARRAVELGAAAVLVNCIAARRMGPFVEALRDVGVPFGAYANAGQPDDRMGWRSAPDEPSRYAEVAQAWIDAGATLVGCCCGTGPAHVAELARRFASRA